MIAELCDGHGTEMKKRTYLPYFFRTNCKSCGKELRTDYTGDEYLSYPVSGEVVKIHFYCPKCQEDQYEEALFEVKVTPLFTHKPRYKSSRCAESG